MANKIQMLRKNICQKNKCGVHTCQTKQKHICFGSFIALYSKKRYAISGLAISGSSTHLRMRPMTCLKSWGKFWVRNIYFYAKTLIQKFNIIWPDLGLTSIKSGWMTCKMTQKTCVAYVCDFYFIVNFVTWP